MLLTRFLPVLLCTALILSGCFSRPAVESRDSSRPVVAVSIVPQASWVKAIAGDLVDVVTVIPPGQSAETYSPTPQQMAQFSKAALYFTLRVPAEEAAILPKVPDLNAKMRIIDLAAAVKAVYPERKLEAHSHAHGEAHDEHEHDEDDEHEHEGGIERDPHIWLSPKRAMVIVKTTAAELAAFDPANKAVYEQNAQAYLDRLSQLDATIQALLKDSKNKRFLIYHPALGYFADDYGLTMTALEAGGKDATPQALQQAIELAKRENNKVVLYEEEMDSRQAKTFAAEIGGVAQKISPFASNYIEAMEQIASLIAKEAR
ncbi:MAG: zinc ABC transporter substrate-binding protein [Sporomusaceae bacterium]|nr:zinc ABC transporter substrate-binding protein [Sporomusaceae bacterium]